MNTTTASRVSVLKPGYLVSLKTALRGGVSYTRQDIEKEHQEGGALVSKWETERQIQNPEEYAAAIVARSACRSAVVGVCSASVFGLMTPLAREGELFDAIRKARTIADAHNGTAASTYVQVFVLVARIAQDDAEAARAISYEIRELLEAMQNGIKTANPEAIREAASKARAMGQMLTDDVAGKVADAIKEARSAARNIVKKASESGEAAALEVAKLYPTGKLEAARFAFLDMTEGTATTTTDAPAARGIDLDPQAQEETPEPAQARPVDLETTPDTIHTAAADARPLELF